MKKHPVDDLFARKLTEWQPKTSPDLWERIEDRQERKSRYPAGWYWYAAASVALVLIAGYIVWQSQSPRLETKNQIFAKIERPQQPQENTSNVDAPYNAPLMAKVEANKTGNDEAIEKSVLSDEGRQVVERSNPKVQRPESELKRIIDPIEVASIEKAEITPESLVQENKEITPSQALAGRLATPNESLVDREKGRVIVAHIDTENANHEDPKSSKLIRILRQLKNAKQGEAIEWDEVGFNPKKLMARADERLRNEEEKVSKKYQELKDKTKL